VLVLCADVPLVTPETLSRLLATAGDNPALLTINMDNPTGYGRILRDATGQVAGIVEEKDAQEHQKAIREINTGLMVLPAGPLRLWLDGLCSDNAQGEYYLTDVVGLARRDGISVHAVTTHDLAEVQGINNRAQLAVVERAWQSRAAHALMHDGVTLLDPDRFDLRGRITAGSDCVIDANVVIEGEVTLGKAVEIGPGCVIRDSTLEDGVQLGPHTLVEGAHLRAGAQAGPFARLREGTELGNDARIGNFVETKATRIGRGSKANHLSYLGDARIGDRVNIGAGTITCNYDGRAKHTTVIEDGAFIGSDTQLVAPVTVGRNATIGAGTSLRRDAPANALTVGAARQRTVPGWSRGESDSGQA
jgi:bifunctional UDP-N-acetylglucosamine pyrophosphorylase/glucosamine-1-phosphate N-acetyltransferase